MKRWYYHQTEGARLFDDADGPFPTEDEGWFDTPAKLDPVAIGEPEPNYQDNQEPSVDEARAEFINELRHYAEVLGIKVDRRWGVNRLKQAIAEAEAEQEHEDADGTGDH